MKIDFDIIFRPQIESGKYKVVTACGVPVEIVKWDCKGRCPILAVWEEDGTSCCRFLTEHGSTENEKEWFYILTAPPEMTGFEKAFYETVQYLLNLPREEVQDNTDLVTNIIDNYKDELLDAAAKQLGVDTGQARKDEDRPDPGPVPDSLWPKSVVDNLMREVDKNTEVILRQFRESPWYREAYSKGYTDGRSESMEDLPSWKRAGEDMNIGCLVWDEQRNFHLYMDRVRKGELYISISDILRLPGSPRREEVEP